MNHHVVDCNARVKSKCENTKEPYHKVVWGAFLPAVLCTVTSYIIPFAQLLHTLFSFVHFIFHFVFLELNYFIA